jgi:hypothetical protein
MKQSSLEGWIDVKLLDFRKVAWDGADATFDPSRVGAERELCGGQLGAACPMAA